MMLYRMKPTISIIIPSYRSRQYVDRCFQAIFQQTAAVPFEVIVVESSQDRELKDDIARTYPSVKLISLERRTFPGEARNIGLREAKGDIIVFTDMDCVPQPGWIETILRLQERSNYRVIGGAVLNGTPRSLIGTAEYIVEFNEFTPSRPEGEARLLPTCNVALKKSVFDEHGGFESVVKGSDTLFTRRLLKRGERIYFTSAFQVTHLNRADWPRFLHNQMDLGKGSAQIRRREQMTGSIFVKLPLLIPLIPFLRLFSIGRRLVQQRSRLFPIFLLTLPLIFSGLLSYAWGFLREALAPSDSPHFMEKHDGSNDKT